MTIANDKPLTDAVEKLNDTASSLIALVAIVDKNQQLLISNQERTEANTDAISLRSTKQELLQEVQRLAAERKKDRIKTKLTVAGSFLMSMLLLLAIFLTTSEYKNARREANIEYAQAAQAVCEQRSRTQDALQAWINIQKKLLLQDEITNQTLKAERLRSYDELLKSFPDVDCDIGGVLTSSFSPPENSISDVPITESVTK